MAPTSGVAPTSPSLISPTSLDPEDVFDDMRHLALHQCNPPGAQANSTATHKDKPLKNPETERTREPKTVPRPSPPRRESFAPKPWDPFVPREPGERREKVVLDRTEKASLILILTLTPAPTLALTLNPN